MLLTHSDADMAGHRCRLDFHASDERFRRLAESGAPIGHNQVCDRMAAFVQGQRKRIVRAMVRHGKPEGTKAS